MNTATVALLFLLVVLVVAAVSSRTVAIITSLIAFVCFNFFFLPPVGTFAISKSDDVVALVALLAVSVIGSQLAHQSRQRGQAAVRLAAERNDAEIAKRDAEAKAALVASISHDLKTPLTALTVAAGNLGMPGLSDEERAELLRLVQTEVGRLKRLFDALIDMASVETRSVTAELEWVHPADVVEAACQRADLALRSRTVDVDDESGNQVVHLDPRLTSAALGHVLENAAMYSPVSSPIVVDVSVAAGRVAFAVRDLGPGIPAAELDRIFDRFYRGAAGTSNAISSGMGLAIARGLLTIQGGRITARNHPAGGAEFTLEVPAPARVVAEPAVET